MTLELQATPQEVMRAVEVFQQFGRERRLGEHEIFGLALALEECGSNIVEHAYGRDSRQKFQVAFEHKGGAITIELRDRGPEFDPTQERVPKSFNEETERPPGGWGLSLVRHYTDELHYRRDAGENVIRLIKRLNQGSDSK
jgi:serine/threonine-protein kinase RsbW